MAFERIESPGPVHAIRLQPGVELHQWFCAKPVHPPLGIVSDLDESSITQHPEVPGHAS